MKMGWNAMFDSWALIGWAGIWTGLWLWSLFLRLQILSPVSHPPIQILTSYFGFISKKTDTRCPSWRSSSFLNAVSVEQQELLQPFHLAFSLSNMLYISLQRSLRLSYHGLVSWENPSSPGGIKRDMFSPSPWAQPPLVWLSFHLFMGSYGNRRWILRRLSHAHMQLSECNGVVTRWSECKSHMKHVKNLIYHRVTYGCNLIFFSHFSTHFYSLSGHWNKLSAVHSNLTSLSEH